MWSETKNADRDLFLISEVFKAMPSDSVAKSMTITNYQLDNMRYNTMTFDTMIRIFRNKTTKGMYCVL